jgi:GAF domain-containing protein/HAMP domain-containing protein
MKQRIQLLIIRFNNLRLTQKLGWISFLFALPLVVMLALLVSETSIRINSYGYQEKDGAAYLRATRRLMQGVQEHQILTARSLSGTASNLDDQIAQQQAIVAQHFAALAQVNSQYGAAFQSSEIVARLEQEWQDLAGQAGNISLATSNERHARLLADLRALISLVGDRSNLILDPDLDSYYMMDTVLLKLPDVQQRLGQIVVDSQSAADLEQLPADERAQLAVQLDLLKAARAATQANVQVAFDNNPAQNLTPIVFEPFQTYLDALEQFLSVAEQSATSANPFQSAELVTAARNVLDQSYRFYDAASLGLDATIQGRIDRAVVRQVAIISGAVISTLLAFAMGLYVMRSTTGSLGALTAVTQRLAGGDLAARASATGGVEVALMGTAFNEMAQRLETTLQSLEVRTEQLRASADVGRTAASVLEPDELLRSVVNLISDRFGFYYTAVFIIDKSGQYAVLREATGEAGRTLKERGHRLEVNGQSMVGSAITRRQPRIALDVGEEAVRFANPLLPDTRSEIALPLIVGDRVLGALDVQSTQEAAFDESSAAVLQSMADQIAIAWNNALSYAETQAVARRSRALFAASREVGRLQADLAETIRATLHAAADTLDYDRWCVLAFNEVRTALVSIAAHDWPQAEEALDVQAQPDHPLAYSAVGNRELFVTEATDPRLSELKIADLHGLICIPIKARDAVVGVMAFGRTSGSELTKDDVDVGRSLANLVAVAIENYNLVETSQRTLRELDEVNRTLTGQSWEKFVRRQSEQNLIWFSRSDQLQPQLLPEVSEALTEGRIATRTLHDAGQLGVAVPIKLRDVPVGALRLIVPQRTWNTEMAAALDSIAGHVAQAAENARLIAETEERLIRERALADATEKVRQRSEIEAILQTAATELARYLNASHIAVHLAPERTPADGNRQ